jgi:hypothetical protein
MPEAERVAMPVTRELTHYPAVTLLSLMGRSGTDRHVPDP